MKLKTLFLTAICSWSCLVVASHESILTHRMEEIRELKDYNRQFMKSISKLSTEDLKKNIDKETELINEFSDQVKQHGLLPKTKFSIQMKLIGAKKRLSALHDELGGREGMKDYM